MIVTDGVHLCCFPHNAAQLHGFAAAIGIRRHWFHAKNSKPHYDLTTPRAAVQAVEAGAFFCSVADIGRMFRAAKTGKEWMPVRLDGGLNNEAVIAQHLRLMARFKRKRKR